MVGEAWVHVRLIAVSCSLALLVTSGCSDDATGGADDAGTTPDAAIVDVASLADARRIDAGFAAADEPFATPVPDTMYAHFGAGALATCLVAGIEIPPHGISVLDDCTVCQCTTYGGRCARRERCTRDVCVFADGQVAARGETLRVDGCFVCTCDASGGSCVRDPEAPCPTDGCLIPAREALEPVVVDFGDEPLVSECHVCTCDATLGTLCENVCHPECFVGGDFEQAVPDQARIAAPGGCGSCVCDYSKFGCDLRGCEDQ